ncbi:hypothetical protein ABTM57_19565, partial [Acinetobacter baumannii]
TRDTQLFRIVAEVNAYIRNFYSGRRSGNDKDIYGKKWGRLSLRPILYPLADDMAKTLERLKFDVSVFDSLWTEFIASLGVPSLKKSSPVAPV